ncbi:MAG: hypothetical protein A3K06_01065 [Candidatus Doudnabacteria bacterium RIFCSPHIGHO2_01_52_17]|uniref:Uncharacterized protein n=1 Tax=Candidatus Doudnabacteria bacterium RIFCSPHIGHO2_01_52_17 TaxID=1817820 RepID=A0A1F5NER4_9BACT|nr:MAG: hypothetical protein UY73_C0001G0011 [Parcubacteria group bacterium GW2011_GWA2_52_8]OGE75950.1 MAG: hypothetical protein A3K06_01065 [Candidatus Doudnabacteria bacterium RIFCSPHIGHO2_01_52_17]
MPTALLVGRDFAGCSGVDRLGNELEKRGHNVNRALGFGKPLTATLDDIRRMVGTASFVVTGRSSSAALAEPEVVALEAALETKVPAFMFSDGWISLLPWFRDYYDKLARLFVLHDYCWSQVKRVFPETCSTVSGCPEWEEFFPSANYDEEKTRVQRLLRELGVPAGVQVILCPGVKDRNLNLELWGDVARAASTASEKFCLLASMHPGDLNDPDEYKRELSARVRVPLFFIRKGDGVNTAQLVPPSDFVIGSLSTLGDRACCQGKRVIDYVSPTALEGLAGLNSLLPEGERRIWPPCQIAGASRLALSSTELETAIHELSTPEGFAPYREAQKRFYGERGPRPGRAVDIMAGAIVAII